MENKFEKKTPLNESKERKRLRAKRKKSRKNWRSNPPFLFSWSSLGCGEKIYFLCYISKISVIFAP